MCELWPSIALFKSSKRDEVWIRQWLERGGMKIDNGLEVENMDLARTCLDMFIKFDNWDDQGILRSVAFSIKETLDNSNEDKTLLDFQKKLLDFILQKEVLDYIKLITAKYNKKANEFIEEAVKSETNIFKIWEFQDRHAKESMESEVMKNLLKKMK